MELENVGCRLDFLRDLLCHLVLMEFLLFSPWLKAQHFVIFVPPHVTLLEF